MPRSLRVAVLTAAAMLLLAAPGDGARVAAPAPAAHGARTRTSRLAVCRQVQARLRARRPAAGRRHLTVLATGDSMIFPALAELRMLAPLGARVPYDRRDGTGIVAPGPFHWSSLARRQARRERPDVTVVTLGGRDAGLPVTGAHGAQVDCCDARWRALYAARARPLVRAWVRGGAGRVYWLSLPAPRDPRRVAPFAAVNEAIAGLVPAFGGRLRIIDTGAALSPGGFRDTVSYDGLTIAPRQADGIHLNHAGACVETDLVAAALLADGILR